MKKNILIVTITFLLLFFGMTVVSSYADWDAESAIGDADDWGVDEENDGGIQSSTKKVVGTAINVIRIVGTGVAIIMLTYVAIKYMSAAPQEKAEFKKSATAMIVGAIVLFASTNILQIIANFANSNIG